MEQRLMMILQIIRLMNIKSGRRGTYRLDALYCHKLSSQSLHSSSHPYLFFNKDGVTFTFVGFIVTPQGDLVDPRRHDRQLQDRPIQDSQYTTGIQHTYLRKSLNSQHMPQVPQARFDYVQDWLGKNTFQSVGALSNSQCFTSSNSSQSRQLSFTSRVPGMVGQQTASSNSIARHHIIERSVMSPELYRGLKLYGVNFDEDYSMWTK